MYSTNECLRAHYEPALPEARKKAFAYVKDHSLVDDVIQETIMKFHKHFGGINHKNYTAWFLCTVQTTAIDIWRRETSLRRKHRRAGRNMQPHYFDARKVSDAEIALEAAVKELPESHQKLITLEYSEGLSVNEIARRLGKTPNAVSVQKFRYKALLRKMISQRLKDCA